jgi:hypothetical protein
MILIIPSKLNYTLHPLLVIIHKPVDAEFVRDQFDNHHQRNQKVIQQMKIEMKPHLNRS